MGATCTRDAKNEVLAIAPVATSEPVSLNVYDLGTSGGGSFLNRLLMPMGTGAFHCGVQMHGWEWSYSDIDNPAFHTGTGVFSCEPRRCEGHTFYKTISMGKTAVAEQDVLRLLALLEKEWLVCAYDVLTHNCCHFCDEVCRRLGVGPLPQWVTHLAGVGAKLTAGDVTDSTCCQVMSGGSMCCKDPRGCDGQEEMIEALPAISSAQQASAQAGSLNSGGCKVIDCDAKADLKGLSGTRLSRVQH